MPHVLTSFLFIENYLVDPFLCSPKSVPLAFNNTEFYPFLDGTVYASLTDADKRTDFRPRLRAPRVIRSVRKVVYGIYHRVFIVRQAKLKSYRMMNDGKSWCEEISLLFYFSKFFHTSKWCVHPL